MTHLRDAAIEAATKALNGHVWVEGRSETAHGKHLVNPQCAICIRDIARVVPLALDAADAALRDIADPPDPDDDHVYLSTACHHGNHNACRLTCKWCGSPCACEHHKETEGGGA